MKKFDCAKIGVKNNKSQFNKKQTRFKINKLRYRL